MPPTSATAIQNAARKRWYCCTTFRWLDHWCSNESPTVMVSVHKLFLGSIDPGSWQSTMENGELIAGKSCVNYLDIPSGLWANPALWYNPMARVDPRPSTLRRPTTKCKGQKNMKRGGYCSSVWYLKSTSDNQTSSMPLHTECYKLTWWISRNSPLEVICFDEIPGIAGTQITTSMYSPKMHSKGWSIWPPATDCSNSQSI